MQKNSKKRYYIAYGSNLNTMQMRWRCPNATVMGTAELKDWRLVFKGSKTGSYLTIEPAKGYTVPVAVWEVTAGDEANLDRYEGYPTFYYKQELELEYKGITSGRKRKREMCSYTSCKRTDHTVFRHGIILKPVPLVMTYLDLILIF